MHDNNSPIGIFDSGVGGLTVARALMDLLPNEPVVYFGDTARVPYGVKSPDTVARYAAQITQQVKVDDALFAQLQQHFDTTEIVELTTAIATYNMVARILVPLGVTPEEH